jgi:hypothetical protein
MGVQQSSATGKKEDRGILKTAIAVAACLALNWLWSAMSPYLPEWHMSVMEQSFWGTFMALMLFGSVFVMIASHGNRDH